MRPVGEMFADTVRPPARLGRNIDHLAPPLGSRDCLAANTVECHAALVGVEIGDRAQQQGLPRARRAAHGDAFAREQGERGRPERGTAKIGGFEHGMTETLLGRPVYHGPQGLYPVYRTRNRKGGVGDYPGTP